MIIDLDELELLEKAATPGEWISGDANPWSPRQRSPFDDYGASIWIGDGEDQTFVVEGGAQDEQGGAVGVLKNEDVKLITALRNVAPALFAELRQLRAALEAVEWMDDPNGYKFCPWCGVQSWKMYDDHPEKLHAADCPRQIALGIERTG